MDAPVRNLCLDGCTPKTQPQLVSRGGYADHKNEKANRKEAPSAEERILTTKIGFHATQYPEPPTHSVRFVALLFINHLECVATPQSDSGGTAGPYFPGGRDTAELCAALNKTRTNAVVVMNLTVGDYDRVVKETRYLLHRESEVTAKRR